MKEASPRSGSRLRSRSRSHTRSRSRSRGRSSQRSYSRSPSITPPRRMRSSERNFLLRRSNRIKVDNLRRFVLKEHLEEIFGHYGEIRLVDMYRSYDYPGYMSSNITFFNPADAEKAVIHMDEGTIDRSVVKVEKIFSYRDAQREVQRERRYYERRRRLHEDQEQEHGRSRSRSRSYGRKPSPRGRNHSRSRSPDRRSRSYTPPPKRKPMD